MKLILSTATALVLASPVLASNQLESQLGVPADLYTTSELVRLNFAKENRGNGRVRIHDRAPGSIIFSTTDSKPKKKAETLLHKWNGAG